MKNIQHETVKDTLHISTKSRKNHSLNSKILGAPTTMAWLKILKDDHFLKSQHSSMSTWMKNQKKKRETNCKSYCCRFCKSQHQSLLPPTQNLVETEPNNQKYLKPNLFPKLERTFVPILIRKKTISCDTAKDFLTRPAKKLQESV